MSSLPTIAAWLAGLTVTLVLASWLTPSGWWRRPTARGAAILAGGTWACGSLLLHFFHAPAPAPEQMPVAFAPAIASSAPPRPAPAIHATPAAPSETAATSASAGIAFHVHRDLNLRSAASVDAPRLAIVPAGTPITPTGLRQGDWWQVRARTDGRDSTGWVSSLWLRRTGE